MSALVIVADDADLAVEVARLAESLALRVEARLTSDRTAPAEGAHGALFVEAPSAETLFEIVRRPGPAPVLGFVGPALHDVVGLGDDLGIPVVRETRQLLAAIAFRATGTAAWCAQVRTLPRAVRARMERSGWTAERSAGKLVLLDEGLVGWQGDSETEIVPLGEPADVAEAAAALRRSAVGQPPGRATLEGVDRAAVRDVLFGPARALSDHASKAALGPYGLPLPLEELCGSPSRAAAEASRIGFPVKISLASPDLRLWDHPDLAIPGVRNAAAAREAFRTITAMAASRDPTARLLGVQVTAETHAWAQLRVTVRAVDELWALADLARADEVGPSTWLALPTSMDRCRAALVRAGSPLPQSRADLEALVDALDRLGVFCVDHRDAVASVRVDPLALVVGGTVEVREACVTVTDAFERSLEVAG